MSGTDPTFPEERARAIWRRAARHQAEAERRMEERARAGAAREDAAKTEEGGLPAREVEAAAVEAGISPEYVRIAMAELSGSDRTAAPLRGWEDRAATRFLGIADRPLEIVHAVPVPAGRAVEEALRVLPAHPCLLRLREVVDVPALPGKALVFEVPKYDWSASANPAFVGSAMMIGLRRVHVTVRELPGDPPSCEMVVSGDLERGIRSQWRFGAAFSAASSAVGAGAGVAAAGSLALTGTMLALPATAGLLLFGGLSTVIWGPLYRYYRTRVTETLEEALRTLEASARVGSEPGPTLLRRPAGG